ncbi:MAG: hypothetical protein [Diaphorina citri cimodo-like virus]|nr:MAG: hypothetical protein [Diaphorina citri cimodo-like virus]
MATQFPQTLRLEVAKILLKYAGIVTHLENGIVPYSLSIVPSFTSLKSKYAAFLQDDGIKTTNDLRERYSGLAYGFSSDPSTIKFRLEIINNVGRFLQNFGAFYGIEVEDWKEIYNSYDTATELLTAIIREDEVLEPGFDQENQEVEEENTTQGSEQDDSYDGETDLEDVADDEDEEVIIGRGRVLKMKDLTVEATFEDDYFIEVKGEKIDDYADVRMRNNAFYCDFLSAFCNCLTSGELTTAAYYSMCTLLTLYGNGDAIEERFGALKRKQDKKRVGSRKKYIKETATKEDVLKAKNGSFYWKMYQFARYSLSKTDAVGLRQSENILTSLMLYTKIFTSEVVERPGFQNRENVVFEMRNKNVPYVNILYAPQLLNYHDMYTNPQGHIWAYTVLVSRLMICTAADRTEIDFEVESDDSDDEDIGEGDDVEGVANTEELKRIRDILPKVKDTYYRWTLYPIREAAIGSAMRMLGRDMLFICLVLEEWLSRV